MCCSHEDDAALDPSDKSPVQSGLGQKGGHKRNLSNGTPGASPLRRSKRQKSASNLKELSSSGESEVEAEVGSIPAKARAKSNRTVTVKKETKEVEVLTSVNHIYEKSVITSEDEVTDVKVVGKATAPAAKPKPAKRGKKTKEEKELEAMPLAPRTQNLRMFVGAHVSAAKGTLLMIL